MPAVTDAHPTTQKLQLTAGFIHQKVKQKTEFFVLSFNQDVLQHEVVGRLSSHSHPSQGKQK